MRSELLPCPHCGARPAHDHTRVDGVRFTCLDCDDATFQDFEQAAEFWNRRSPSRSPPQGERQPPDAGVKLVPVEPTVEMLSVATKLALNVKLGGEYRWPNYLRDLYSAMLAAAPALRQELSDLRAERGGEREKVARIICGFDGAVGKNTAVGDAIWHGALAKADAILAALAASPPAGEVERMREAWRPIETAPKDGTPIIATVRVYNHGRFSHHDTHIVWTDDETGEIANEAEQGWRLEDYDFWMPLPEPPAPDKGVSPPLGGNSDEPSRANQETGDA